MGDIRVVARVLDDGRQRRVFREFLAGKRKGRTLALGQDDLDRIGKGASQ